MSWFAPLGVTDKPGFVTVMVIDEEGRYAHRKVSVQLLEESRDNKIMQAELARMLADLAVIEGRA